MQRRKSLNLTQKELAAQVHFSLGTIHGVEQGVQRPSRQLAEFLAVALQVPPGERKAFSLSTKRYLIARHCVRSRRLTYRRSPLVSHAEVNDDTRPAIKAPRIESSTV